MKRYAILAEGGFVEHDAKTAIGVLRYCAAPDRGRDRLHPGRQPRRRPRARPGLDVPIVAGVDEALALGATVLLIGIAPAGGAPARQLAGRDPGRRRGRGLDIESGLHDFLGDDPQLAAAAAGAGVEIRDLRRAPGRARRARRRQPDRRRARPCSRSAPTARWAR